MAADQGDDLFRLIFERGFALRFEGVFLLEAQAPRAAPRRWREFEMKFEARERFFNGLWPGLSIAVARQARLQQR